MFLLLSEMIRNEDKPERDSGDDKEPEKTFAGNKSRITEEMPLKD